MKILLTYFFTMTFLLKMNAAVLTVNNMSGGPGQFTDATIALNAANAADTLYISPSSTSYGDLIINKSITVIGKGSHADVQLAGYASFSSISINDSLSSVNIMGVSTTIILFGYDCHLISVARCYITYCIFLNTNVTNCAISNCIFSASNNNNILASSSSVGSSFPGISNVLIQNNIFNGYIAGLAGNNIIQNNVYLCNTWAFFTYFGVVSGAFIQNNIFFSANPSANTSGCTFNNNITFDAGGTTFSPLGGTNIDNTDPLFVYNTNTGDPFNYAYDYHLQATSPGHNAGTDGTDIGMYGGNSPMSTTGEPFGVPIIRKMEVQNFNAPQNGNVNVKVRSTKSR